MHMVHSRRFGSPPSRFRRSWSAGAAAAALALGTLAAAPAAAQAAPNDPEAAAAGMPGGVPEAALRSEPQLPAPAGWDFSDDFSRTSGTSRLDDGALLWTDWLYDDTGTGDFTYDDPDAGANGADVFRAGVAVDETQTHWRVDWNTLIDPDVPIAAWAFDTDSDPATGTDAWPAGAGVHSPGIDTALVVSSRGAQLIDLQSGDAADVADLGGRLTVDTDARSFVVSVPRDALAVDGEWTARLVAGVADADGTGFAAAPEAPDGTRVYNAAFRDMDDEPHLVGDTGDASTEWNNGRQSERLADGDVSDFALALDWRDLASGTTTPEPQPSGYSTRWYVSSLDLGQGMDPAARRSPGPALQPATFFGRVQPYTVYVPTTYDPDDPAPLTIMMHGGDGNHNAFLSDRKDDVHRPLCEERGSICLSPLGRGLSAWYLNEAEVDVWETWNRVAQAYALDPARTTISGFSMGGVGATRIATNYPQAFAGAAIVSGAGYFNTAGERDRSGAELRAENLVGLNTLIVSGTADIAEQNTRTWDAEMHKAGIAYRAEYFDGGDHGTLGTWLGWADVADYLDGRTTSTPGEFAFRWEPGDGRADLGTPIDRAHWASGLSDRDDDARWARITARSGALATTEQEPELTEETRVIAGRDAEVRDQQIVPGNPIERENRIELAAENVASLTVDLDMAGISDAEPAAIDIITDGPTELTWTQGSRSGTVTVGEGEHTLAVDGSAPEIDAAAPHCPLPSSAPGAITVAATDASGIVSVDATLRDTTGRTVAQLAPTSAPAGEQTWTGEIALPDDLKPRRYRLEIRATDASGETSSTTMSFTLNGR
ncbi:alpha/beta hydrolase-fold protein [Microbacterium sp.]|uniref:alpha/beta hydrolase-fold protein n=1 Tax=Microbacterium sp. TaxID=51671 RepID=UPI003F9E5C14